MNLMKKMISDLFWLSKGEQIFQAVQLLCDPHAHAYNFLHLGKTSMCILGMMYILTPQNIIVLFFSSVLTLSSHKL